MRNIEPMLNSRLSIEWTTKMYMAAFLLSMVRKDSSAVKRVLRGPERHRLSATTSRKNHFTPV